MDFDFCMTFENDQTMTQNKEKKIEIQKKYRLKKTKLVVVVFFFAPFISSLNLII